MRGRLFCNGNVREETAFIHQAREHLLSSCHQDSDIQASQKVLLVTAGWRENEYREGHLKDALRSIGIPSGPDNIQNLSLYHIYQEFLEQRPALAEQWRVREQLIESAQQLYMEKNGFYTAMLRRWLDKARTYLPQHHLSHVWSQVHLALPTTFDGEALVGHFIGRDLHDTLLALIHNDDALVELLGDLESQFSLGIGLHLDPAWLNARSELTRRILSANSIFMFGGHLAALHRCLSFFALRDVLVEALRRGSSFYTVSAGSLLCCERVIVYDDFASNSEFQLFDRGFGLVRHLQLFPHCMDRIQTDDEDNLAYLAQRFRSRTCVGLNEDSLLLVEMSPHLRCRSVGREDGVYVFDTHGQKKRYDYGQEIPPGGQL